MLDEDGSMAILSACIVEAATHELGTAFISNG